MMHGPTNVKDELRVTDSWELQGSSPLMARGDVWDPP